jgi:hypothetical protein
MIIRAKLPGERRFRGVDLSTGHFPKGFLDDSRVISGFFRIVAYEHGAVLLRIGDTKPAQEDWEQVLFHEGIEMYKWLLAFHQWCREHSLDVITADCDANELPGLPTFDW